jgi:diguanylate cyclase (GGDEF)-like protein
LIDVDFFKKFNDAHGHQRADECLRRIAGALSGVVQRPGDLVARYGGEEFAVILPNTDVDGAQAVAANLRTGVAALAIPHQASEVSKFVTVSLGVATAKPSDGTQPSQLVEAADGALYDAKRTGRNRISTNAA